MNNLVNQLIVYQELWYLHVLEYNLKYYEFDVNYNAF